MVCQVYQADAVVLQDSEQIHRHFLQAGIKKRFDDRFVLSFSVRNILDRGQQVGASGDGFVRTVHIRQTWSNIQYRFGVTWNFKSGKAFQKRSVEAGSEEEKKRL